MTQTIGEQLKQARQKRGLTLEQVAQATHIRKYYLEALENDQRDALPSNVQARGFLRLYADAINLPVAPLLAAWDGKLMPEPETLPADEPHGPPQNPPLPAASTQPETPVLPDAAAEPAPQEHDLELPVEEEPVSPPYQPAAADGNTSQAIFREIGQTLRQQREGLGLSRVEVERYTRLRQHYIIAMEDGNMEELPSTVQGRGMLSNYAAFLNLDEEKILLRFAEGLQARRIERMPKPEPQKLFSNKRRPARQAPIWKRFLTPDLIFGVGVAAIILLFVLWTAARINNLRVSKANPTPPGVGAVLLTPGPGQTVTLNATQVALAKLAGAAGKPGSTSVAGEASAGSTTPTPKTFEPGSASANATVPAGQAPVMTVAQAGGNAAVPVTTATIPTLNKDPFQVYIIAKQRAWLRVVADDKVKFLGRTVPGNAYAFSGTKRLELATGNAAALQVFYNQNDLGTLGTEGQAVALVFAAEGVMTPTPAFTATGTPTKPATMTPLPSPTPPATATITPFVP